jgi:hypothetical protein
VGLPESVESEVLISAWASIQITHASGYVLQTRQDHVCKPQGVRTHANVPDIVPMASEQIQFNEGGKLDVI